MKMIQPAVLIFLAAILVTPARAAGQNCEQCLGGSADSPIRIEVFSDFQCPSCRVFYMETIKPVLKNYSGLDKVCVIYREYPLNMHPLARDAARYSVAAQKLGHSQWLAVFDTLYSEQESWSKSGLVQAAVAKALSPADFQKLLKLAQDPSINQAIERDIAMGQKRQVDQTPTFFFSTPISKEQKVVGGVPYAVLKDLFDRIVK